MAGEGGLGLLRDRQDLYLMAAPCDITWTPMQLEWLRTRMKQAAPQALVVT